MRVSNVQKITLAALLLALTIILTRITPFQNWPVIPWVRISLGPALIIFSSIFLGPFYGAIVGAGSDILGIVLFPNSLGYGINPLFTLVYGLLGILPWLIYQGTKLIKNQQIMNILMIIAAFLLVFIVGYFLFFSPLIETNYGLEIYQKWLFLSLSILLVIATIIGLFFINKYYVKRYGQIYSPYKIALVTILSELIVLLFLNSFVKAYTFSVDYFVIFFAQAIVFFIDVPLNTFVVTGLLILANKISHRNA